MVRDPYLRKRQVELKEQIAELGSKKKQIQLALESLGLTDGQKKKAWDSDVELAKLRTKWVGQIKEIEEKLKPIKNELREVHEKMEVANNGIVMELLREIFSQQQLSEIKQEIGRRANGEQPYPLGLDLKNLEKYKTDYTKYRNF